ncbi:MAG: AbrB family transcriptional regulator [Thermoanaerobaculia bacterium]
MSTGKVLADGLMTLPEEIQKHLHLQTGDRIDFEIDSQGTVHLQPANASFRKVLGMFHRPDLPPRTLEELREGMIEFLVEDNERIKRGLE